MYNDEFRYKNDDDTFKFQNVKQFCRMFVQTPDVNQQISYGMRSLIFNQLVLLQQYYPQNYNPFLYININGFRPNDINNKCQSMKYTILVVLAAKRFAKHVLEKRKIIQELKILSLTQD